MRNPVIVFGVDRMPKGCLVDPRHGGRDKLVSKNSIQKVRLLTRRSSELKDESCGATS